MLSTDLLPKVARVVGEALTAGSLGGRTEEENEEQEEQGHGVMCYRAGGGGGEVEGEGWEGDEEVVAVPRVCKK